MTYLNDYIFLYPFRTFTKRGTMVLKFSLKQQAFILTSRQIKTPYSKNIGFKELNESFSLSVC